MMYEIMFKHRHNTFKQQEQQETNMATITKIVRNIYGEMELIQQIVPDGWGVTVVEHPPSPYSIWRRTALPNKAATWRGESEENVARILDLWRDPANFFRLVEFGEDEEQE